MSPLDSIPSERRNEEDVAGSADGSRLGRMGGGGEGGGGVVVSEIGGLSEVGQARKSSKEWCQAASERKDYMAPITLK